ncbi:FAD-binding domain-containing protein [Verticillium dahliae]|nr:FAD-binding domain-containing protein [Verticillium dahliae]
MSRYFSTFMRKSYYVSRFFNWDLSQEFHIRISCVAILLATLHALGHLTGSFVSGSDPNNETEVAHLLGDDMVPRPYIEYVRSVPGVTGITALGCFYLLSLLSIPQVRRWNYEVFQLGHLLMFPIIGLMMAHGTAHLLQWPMFGYFLAFPTLLVVVERVVRVVLGFHRIRATMKCLDDDTVEITAIIPSERLWRYKAGQYIFLQVPEISIWQWHPFTVSVCIGNKMQVHIKTDGNWTGRLRKLGGDAGESEIEVGINGPFGAPAQRFYEFNHSVIIGAGIGVTPFSGILADLQAHDDMSHGGPAHLEAGHLQDRHDSDATAADPADASGKFEKVTGGDGMLLGSDEAKRGKAKDCSSQQDDDNNETRPENDEFVNADTINTSRRPEAGKSRDFADDYRRVDFHWMVRDRNYLSWLSDLLNEVSRSQEWHREHEDQPHLDIRIQTHVTAKRKDIVTHVYRWLLEMHRTDDHPASPLTGLLNPTHFGRPDFNDILDRHYDEMSAFRRSKREEARGEKPGSSARREGAGDAEYYKEDEELKVGVFYCGAPVVGEILADKCSELTTRGRHDGSKIEYHFMIEVFG